MEKRKLPLFIEFICAVFWKIRQCLLASVEIVLFPIAYIGDGVIEWGKDLLDEYRNRKDAEGLK